MNQFVTATDWCSQCDHAQTFLKSFLGQGCISYLKDTATDKSGTKVEGQNGGLAVPPVVTPGAKPLVR